jgi:redox-sensitive bicupin YhaK (pirin superfamily)
MVAGSGLIHSEFPEQTEGHMEGFQLWINLPAADKLCPPAYRDFLPEELPRVSPSEGAELVVLAGDINGVRGPIGQPRTDCLFLDIHLLGDAAIELPIPRGHTAFLCPYRGPLSVEGCEVPDRHLAILTQSGDSLRLHATGYRRAILVAGRPLGEPIAQHGPFVMNTAQELLAALSDYQNGVFARASVARL